MNVRRARQEAFARDVAEVVAPALDRNEVDSDMDDRNVTLDQLNIELFSELHRLREVDVHDAEALKAEVDRSRAVEGISKTIISNANTMLEVTRLRAEYSKTVDVPRMLKE